MQHRIDIIKIETSPSYVPHRMYYVNVNDAV